MKIKSLEELRKIKEQAKADTQLRATGENPDRIVVAVGMATCGIAAGARPVMNALLEEVDKNNLSNVSVITTGCIGYCYAEPLVEVRMPDREPIRYANVTDSIAREIIKKHIMQDILIDHAILPKGTGRQEGIHE